MTARAREAALLALLAVALGTLEGLVPRPVPFLKLGLANAAVILALVRLGAAGAAVVTGVRVAGVGLATGVLATPSFALSASGALASLAVMGLLCHLRPGAVSVVGISVAGGEASMLGQLGAAALILPELPLRSLAAPAVAWGCVSGALVGVAANWLLRRGRLESALDRLARGASEG
ncbi:MAG: Gx transporter family protein [Candidatus Fermentibacteraceae bacterium]